MRTLITINKIGKRFGSKIIFNEASLAIFENQKIGVIGRNGAGKSTLCKLITGIEEPDEGEIVNSTDLNLGFLEQHDSFLPTETPLEFLMRFTGKKDWECGRTAGKFQIKGEMLLKKLIGELSGGYKTRIKLAAMLLMEPNFLILDEPTNFLDMKTQLLLENFLKSYNGGFIVVSHDKEFLRKTCLTTLDVAYGEFEHFPGNIDAYLEEKLLRVDQIERTNKNMVLKQKQLQTFIDKNKAKASGASQARNKQKQLDRLELSDIRVEEKKVKIKIPHIESKNGRALQCFELTIGYEDKKVVEKIDLVVERGAHVAILGENGQGKTTFLKSIASDLPILSGTIKWGHQIEIAYYAQHVYHSIPEIENVYSYLEKCAQKNVLRQEILDMAGNFLFHGDDVLKSVKVLSGGERARLCLAGLLLKKADVLLMDEPTNHLDFETVQALGKTLGGFNGTVFFVCHDREFIKTIAKQVIEINLGRLRDFPGRYEDYLYYLESEIEEQGKDEPQSKPVEKVKLTVKETQDQKELFEKRKRTKNRLQKQQKELEKTRQEKSDLEAKMAKDVSLCTDQNAALIDKLFHAARKLEDETLELMIELEDGGNE